MFSSMLGNGSKTIGPNCTTLGISEHALLVDPLLEASLRAFFPYQRLDRGKEEEGKDGEERRGEVRRERERRG